MKEFVIAPNEAGQRLDKYLNKLLPGGSVGFFYKMLRKKNFVLNGKKASGREILSVGDRIKLFLSDETFEQLSLTQKRTGEEFGLYSKQALSAAHLTIVYEDSQILIFNKPAGMLSQKSQKDDVSVNEYLIGYLLYQQELTTEALRTFRPAAANRLDRNTSGLILCGKSLAGLQYLSYIIRDRSLQKYYRCLVRGELTKRQMLEGYLVKDPETNCVAVTAQPPVGKEAAAVKTEINPIGRYMWQGKRYTELSVHLITGKPHQIRAHLASVGHPIVGDPKYGQKTGEGGRLCHRQLLHAYAVVFPETTGAFSYLNQRRFTADFPPDYEKAREKLVCGNQ